MEVFLRVLPDGDGQKLIPHELNLGGSVERDRRVCTNRNMGFVSLLGRSGDNVSPLLKKEKMYNVDVRELRPIMFINFVGLSIVVAI